MNAFSDHPHTRGMFQLLREASGNTWSDAGGGTCARLGALCFFPRF